MPKQNQQQRRTAVMDKPAGTQTGQLGAANAPLGENLATRAGTAQTSFAIDMADLETPAPPAPNGATRLDIMTKAVVRDLQDQGIDPYQTLADGVTTIYDFVWASNLRDLITESKVKLGGVVANTFENEKWQLLGEVTASVREPGLQRSGVLGQAASPFGQTGFAAQEATATDADEGYEVYDGSIFTSPVD